MPQRIRGLTEAEFNHVVAELLRLETRVVALGNVLTPALGTAWCDRALRIYRELGKLRRRVADHYEDEQDRSQTRP
jgi:hypothetical protein